jgi:hypothetical protein
MMSPTSAPPTDPISRMIRISIVEIPPVRKFFGPAYRYENSCIICPGMLYNLSSLHGAALMMEMVTGDRLTPAAISNSGGFSGVCNKKQSRQTVFWLKLGD